ncbi:MAG: hypothetical protein HYY23_08325, partial [Verrucomicrobia bacterium]|nr:hypothetical protein [Verrucomicrobiota bacterium]
LSVSPEIVAGCDDLFGARPSRPQQLQIPVTREILPEPSSGRTRCGLEGRAPFQLRFDRAAPYRRFAIGSAPASSRGFELFGSPQNAIRHGRLQICATTNAAPSRAGFTMVEIALSLAIIAFALVAIIGVLPAGVKVQQENREETVINQDGLYLLEAIRTGSKGVDDLTNYVESVTVRYGRLNSISFTNTTAANVPNRLTNGLQIIGLLSTPKFERMPDGSTRSNAVEAHVRAITGVAGEKSRLNDQLAFRYLVRSEVMPFINRPPGWISGRSNEFSIATNLLNNLYDVRLTLRWPLYQKGQNWETGRSRKSFRTLVSGELRPFTPPRSRYSFYWFEPNAFATNALVAGF